MRALLATVLIGCAAPPIELAPDPEAPRALVVETWQPLLGFPTDYRHTDQLANVADSLGRDEGVDLVCLRSPLSSAERESILTATRTLYPHVGFVRTDRDTPIDDPRDLTGVARNLPTTAACTDAADRAALERWIDCCTGCLTVDGRLEDKCLVEKCLPLPPPSGPRCAVCMQSATRYGPVSEVRRTCEEVPNGELAADGQLGLLLLSKHPLTEIRAQLFPSTMLRHGALSATVHLSTRSVGVLCGYFDGFSNPIQPYSGVFGEPEPAGGSNIEQILFSLRMVQAARAMPAERTTLVLGGDVPMWRLARKTRALSMQQNWDYFATNLLPLVWPSDLCTVCGDNAFLTGLWPDVKVDSLESLAFAIGPPPQVSWVASGRTEARYQTMGRSGPAAPFYSLRARVIVP